MSNLAAAHNRLIDYATIADMRGADDAARSLRFSARLLAMLINNGAAQRIEAQRGETAKQARSEGRKPGGEAMRPNSVGQSL